MGNIKLLHICVIFASGLLITGCLSTEGTLEIKGKVSDEYSGTQIPGRNIIVQGLVGRDRNTVPVDAGQFVSDSSGYFTYTLKKVKDAFYYNFCLVGDSDYSFRTIKLGLLELNQNAKYLSFPLSRLVDFRIIINKKSMPLFCDTLYLFWESDGVDFRVLYPYKIENYGISDSFVGLTSYAGLVWIGRNANSTVKTRVFANKKTRIHWELIRNRKRKEFTDTLTCKRDFTNIVNFTY